MIKGATNFDQLCHMVFARKSCSYDYLSRRTGVRCGHCGQALGAYYCEAQLYLVECIGCETKALVTARNPEEAAYKTFGHAVYGPDGKEEMEIDE